MQSRLLLLFLFSWVFSVSQKIVPYFDITNCKYGFKDASGTIVIPSQFDAAYPWDIKESIAEYQTYYHVRKDSLYGLISAKGNWVFSPVYPEIQFLSVIEKLSTEEGSRYFLCGKRANRFTVYNTRSKKSIDIECSAITVRINEKTKDEILVVRRGLLKSVMNDDLEVVIKPQIHDIIGQIAKDRYLVGHYERPGLLNEKGKMIIPMDEGSISEVKKDNYTAFVRMNEIGRRGHRKKIIRLYDINGNPQSSYLHVNPSADVGEYFICWRIGRKKGIININGTLTTPFEYDNLEANLMFGVDSSSRIIATKGNKKGLITVNNKILTPFIYDQIRGNTFLIGRQDQRIDMLHPANGKVLCENPDEYGSCQYYFEDRGYNSSYFYMIKNDQLYLLFQDSIFKLYNSFSTFSEDKNLRFHLFHRGYPKEDPRYPLNDIIEVRNGGILYRGPMPFVVEKKQALIKENVNPPVLDKQQMTDEYLIYQDTLLYSKVYRTATVLLNRGSYAGEETHSWRIENMADKKDIVLSDLFRLDKDFRSALFQKIYDALKITSYPGNPQCGELDDMIRGMMNNFLVTNKGIYFIYSFEYNRSWKNITQQSTVPGLVFIPYTSMKDLLSERWLRRYL